MMKNNENINVKEKQFNHLTFKDRALIQHALDNGNNITHIAKMLKKSKSTIAREINRTFRTKAANTFNSFNICENRYHCEIKDLCHKCESNVKKCSLCKRCNKVCESFNPVCERLEKSPHVCNGCEKRRYCIKPKRIYDADVAEKLYQTKLVSARTDPNKGSSFVKKLNEKLSPHMEDGKSINNFLMTNPKLAFISPATVYRYYNYGYFDIKPDDITKKRKRGNKLYANPQPKAKHVIEGRTYQDYLKRVESDDFFETVEMDTVLSKRGSQKAILTFCFTKTNLLLAILIDNKTEKAVKTAVNMLNTLLIKAGSSFHELFPVILTDNGSEFSNPLNFELDEYGEYRSSMYYCTPYTSCQKPHVERAHRELRRFIPKGTSFESLTQESLNLMLSHLNSYKLKSLNGLSPYDTFVFHYGQDILDALSIHKIDDHMIVRNHESFLRLITENEKI